jgi:hypothetical protein
MHAAPPVQVTFGPDRIASILASVLAAVTAADLAAWLMSRFEMEGVVTLGVALAAAGAAAAGAWWITTRRSPTGTLAWDGRAWTVELQHHTPFEGRPTVAMDLDRWMLLRFEPALPGRRLWIALTCTTVGAAWGPLRGALYSMRPVDGPPRAAPPA